MRRSSLYTSAAFHLLLLMLAIMGLPFLTYHQYDIPQPITVDLVEISKITQTNRVAPPQPAPPKPKPPEPPKPQPAPPAPAPQPTPPVPQPPQPAPVKPTPPVQQVDENAPPKKEKKVVKKEEPKKPQVQPNFASVLKDLDVNKKTPPTTRAPAQTAPLGEKMTMSEEDALRSQLEQCWDVPIGAKDVENMTVDIAMVINSDRTLREAHIVDTARYNSDTVFQAVADSALRAVQRCSPFDVPPDKYNTWNTTTVTFNPKDMF